MRDENNAADDADQGRKFIEAILSDAPIPLPVGVSLRLSERESRFIRFTPQERQIGGWVAEGKGNSDIAKILGIGIESVRTYVKRLLEKADVETRHAFVAWVWRLRLNVQISHVEKWKPTKYT